MKQVAWAFPDLNIMPFDPEEEEEGGEEDEEGAKGAETVALGGAEVDNQGSDIPPT